jgi:hypothetical protein
VGSTRGYDAITMQTTRMRRRERETDLSRSRVRRIRWPAWHWLARGWSLRRARLRLRAVLDSVVKRLGLKPAKPVKPILGQAEPNEDRLGSACMCEFFHLAVTDLGIRSPSPCPRLRRRQSQAYTNTSASYSSSPEPLRTYIRCWLGEMAVQGDILIAFTQAKQCERSAYRLELQAG